MLTPSVNRAILAAAASLSIACTRASASIPESNARASEPAFVAAPGGGPGPLSTRGAAGGGVQRAIAESPPVVAAPPPAPLLADAQIAARLASDPASLGALSIGGPSRGALFNAVQMPEGPYWRVVEPARAWGAPEAIHSIARAIEAVHAEYPDAPPLYVGHLSAPRGGYLRPHRSHQSGRDVDLGYYYSDGPGWYSRATAQTLDRARTWALVRALARDPNVESIFMDRSVQLLLREHALREGERREWIYELFDGGRRGEERLVRHEWGHLTHLHVRFRCTESLENGSRAAPVLARTGKVSPAFLPATKGGRQPSRRSTAAVIAGSSGAVPGSKRPWT